MLGFVASESLCTDTYFKQEAHRYEDLVVSVQRDLLLLKQALSGNIVFTPELEEILSEINKAQVGIIEGSGVGRLLEFLSSSDRETLPTPAQVPSKWRRRCFPTLRSLGAWVQDLAKRLHFATQCCATSAKNSVSAFWLSGCFHPKGFLTAALQRAARSVGISPNQLETRASCLNHHDPS